MKMNAHSAVGIGWSAHHSQTYQEMVASKPIHKQMSAKMSARCGPRVSKACEDGHHSVCFKKNCTCQECNHGYVGA